MRVLRPAQPERILVRGVNWVGDAVMSLPALQALVRACPGATIDVLARPWVAELYAMQPGVNQVLIIDDGAADKGLAGFFRVVKKMRVHDYQWAVLLQNAFKAAALAFMAGIKQRLGYDRDGRRLLLTHAVPCPASIRRVHETAYYLNILYQAGLAPAPDQDGQTPELHISQQVRAWAEDFLQKHQLSGLPLLGLAPGASFGPAKCWPALNFAAASKELAKQRGMVVLIFGSKAEASVAAEVKQGLDNVQVVDLCGQLGLAQALALLERLDLLITNDSGLMHATAALGRPTCAVFGSTNPQTTRPLGKKVRVLRKSFDCSPCKQKVCPRGDMRCFWAITPAEVVEASLGLLDEE